MKTRRHSPLPFVSIQNPTVAPHGRPLPASTAPSRRNDEAVRPSGPPLHHSELKLVDYASTTPTTPSRLDNRVANPSSNPRQAKTNPRRRQRLKRPPPLAASPPREQATSPPPPTASLTVAQLDGRPLGPSSTFDASKLDVKPIPAPRDPSHVDQETSLTPLTPRDELEDLRRKVEEVDELRRRLREQETATEALKQRVRDLEELEEQRAARRAKPTLRPLLLAKCQVTTSPSRASSTSFSSPPLTPPEMKIDPSSTASPSSWAVILAPRPLPSLVAQPEEETIPRPPTSPPCKGNTQKSEETRSKL
jgi:hypothetical protein